MPCRNHLRPREASLLDEPIQADAGQGRQEQEQAPELGTELPRAQVQVADIGDFGRSRAGPWWAFLVQTSGKPGKSFRLEELRDGHRAQGLPLLVEGAADVVDGEVLLAQ